MGKHTSGQSCAKPAWRRVGERGIRLDTGDATLTLYSWLVSQELKEIEDMIPADGSLLLVLRRGATISPGLRNMLARPFPDFRTETGRLHEIAVEYGGEAGPDLPELATRAGLSETDYIARHAATEYTVAFLGFQPGFPYLQGLPQALQVPRRATPRVRVAAGSVAIGGAYSGIYPACGPGGWHVIGHTAAVLFDPHRSAPALLTPGDRVRFIPQ